MEAEEKQASAALETELAQIPNLPLDDVPDGADEKGNVEHHQSGNKRNYAFTPKQHFELGEALGMMDFELAAKLSGARFVVLQKGLARMERALGQFMLDCIPARAWLHRGQSADPGTRRGDVWDGAVAEVCRRPIFCVTPAAKARAQPVQSGSRQLRKLRVKPGSLEMDKDSLVTFRA